MWYSTRAYADGTIRTKDHRKYIILGETGFTVKLLRAADCFGRSWMLLFCQQSSTSGSSLVFSEGRLFLGNIANFTEWLNRDEITERNEQISSVEFFFENSGLLNLSCFFFDSVRSGVFRLENFGVEYLYIYAD